MSDTVLNVRTLVRQRLEELSARFWSNAELTSNCYEAAKIIARRAECLQDFFPINVVPNQSKYALPYDGLRVHRCEFTPLGSQTQTFVLEPRTRYEADMHWGTFQQQAGSYPRLFVIDGYAPGVAANTAAPNAYTNNYWSIQMFPVPSQPGTATVWYYRIPKALTGSDNDILEIPNGWEDLLVWYCLYVGLMKDKDAMWQEAKNQFEAELDAMVEKTAILHDQSQWFNRGGGWVNDWVRSTGYEDF